MNLDFGQLRALSAAVRCGTFDAAAAALHVTPSAISQRIKALETEVGRVLLVRSRPLAVTDAGASVLRTARQIEALSADLARDLSGGGDGDGEGGGGGPVTVPLAVNADSLSTWALPAFAGLAGHLFEIHREDEEHTVSLLRDGTVMAAITADSAPVQGCTVERLGTMRYLAVAAPDFAEHWFPDGVTADALAAAPHVDFDHKDDLQRRYIRSRTRRRLAPPRHRVPASADFAEAVALGLGWAMVPSMQVEAMGDRLVHIDPDHPLDRPLYWQQWRLRSPALDTVAAAVMEAARTTLR
ncbi:LysR family transcriptional regulator ArgP [Nocardiopsis potens]|uniref:LysR family transcriptional regulator ArgP n=1 Tax=Nocardiopsis potens TaxID=1246458 RepID=UPI0004756874|nr:LysR family transcriptional regulator ArgP [Nocardiopsis potens]